MDSSKTTQMELAIAHLNRQKLLDYAAVSRTYGIYLLVLAQRHKGLTVSRAEANSTYY
jgi:hypothetical protein